MTIRILSAILLFSILLYIPLFTREWKVYYNPKTGLREVFGTFPLWASILTVCIVPLPIILPANIVIIW